MAYVELHRFIVHWDPYRSSRNVMDRIMDVKIRTGIKDAARSAAGWAWREYGDRCFCVKVRVSVVVYRGSWMDERNAIDGLKFIDDALFSIWKDSYGDGFLPHDGPQWLHNGELTIVADRQYADSPYCEYIIETDPEWPRPKMPRGLRYCERLDLMERGMLPEPKPRKPKPPKQVKGGWKPPLKFRRAARGSDA